MKKRKRIVVGLSDQMKTRIRKPAEKKAEYEGSIETMISTGSTLLDLAISGGRVKGGGIPGGILVEIFGPNGSGKTVLLCEIAGMVQRKGGEIMFKDPEARLNKQFARMFDLNTDKMDYSTPNTVPELFAPIRKWDPANKIINGIFGDSLAALSTDLEMDNDDGDKMGMRRAKELSEELRKTCRIIADKNFLMVCSNQIRETMNQFGPKYKAPGGEAVGFYASLRLRTETTKKIKETVRYKGKEVTKIIGVEINVEVFKNSCWKPYGTAPVTIIFDYGIDDIRQNLQFVKTYSKNTMYYVNETKLEVSMDQSISKVEELGLEKELREQVIDIWLDIESRFKSDRKSKER